MVLLYEFILLQFYFIFARYYLELYFGTFRIVEHFVMRLFLQDFTDRLTPSRNRYPPLAEMSGIAEGDLNASICCLTPTFQRTTHFEPIKLSPTVLGDIDYFSKEGSPSVQSCTTNVLRRESGLVQEPKL